MRILAVAIVAALLLPGCFKLGPTSVEPKDYLRSDTYSKWVIEVDSASGEQPSTSLLNFLKSRLSPLVHKDAVEFRLDETLQAGDTTWGDGDLESFAATHQGTKTAEGTVVTHLLFLAGHSEHDNGNSKVLGITFGHGLIVIFSDSVKASCDSAIPVPGLCSTDPYFRAVLMHEFGHALGLVNNGVPMVKAHEASTCNNQADERHSANKESVMYCQVESSSIVPIFGNNPPTDFDADDKADLKAAGGK